MCNDSDVKIATIIRVNFGCVGFAIGCVGFAIRRKIL